ncbi:MAG: hypothetical protein JXA21_07840 [Anaerolineae bacterium]|nr:hypothetical protein [Anaerolineae bacterium]
MSAANHNHLVVALSAAGVGFILLGLFVLALPTPHEGIFVWQLDSGHALYLMDIAGVFNLAIGVVLTWLSGEFWSRQLRN